MGWQLRELIGDVEGVLLLLGLVWTEGFTVFEADDEEARVADVGD